MPWTPPAGCEAAIRFKKPDGTTGWYDADENDDDAITVSGNVATLYLAEQVLMVPGTVQMELNFYTAAGAKLTSFEWQLIVHPCIVTDITIASSDYYNVLTAQVANALAYKEAAAASATAAAASAASAATTLASAVKAVNGVLPDSTGEVDITAENVPGAVRTVNGNAPTDGAVTIPMVANSTDYVIEQGTSGIWSYRKWNSGIAECWGTQSTNVDCTTSWGTGLYYTGSQYVYSDFPTGLFLEAPTVSFGWRSLNSLLALPASATITATTTLRLQFARTTSMTAIPVQVCWNAIGKWN